MSSLKLDGITKRYGQTTVLDSVSLEVEEGELLALLGPSGCGKSTLLRIAAGLTEADEGKVLIGGQDMNGVSSRNRGVGLVFQRYALFPHMSVAANIAFGLKARGWPRSKISGRVNELLAAMKLSGFNNRRPDQLSGGQAQRVAIARTLAAEPSLVLLDEPMASLDPELREETRRFIRSVHDQWRLTTVLVTHDQVEAIETADRVAIMASGKILRSGTPQDIYLNPGSVTVARFLGMRNIFPGKVARDSEGSFVETGIGRLHFDNAQGIADGAPVFAAFRPEHAVESGRMPGGADALMGRVIRRVFSGAAETIEVEQSGQTVFLSRPASYNSSRPLPGEAFSFTVPAEMVRVFPEL